MHVLLQVYVCDFQRQRLLQVWLRTSGNFGSNPGIPQQLEGETHVEPFLQLVQPRWHKDTIGSGCKFFHCQFSTGVWTAFPKCNISGIRSNADAPMVWFCSINTTMYYGNVIDIPYSLSFYSIPVLITNFMCGRRGQWCSAIIVIYNKAYWQLPTTSCYLCLLSEKKRLLEHTRT